MFVIMYVKAFRVIPDPQLCTIPDFFVRRVHAVIFLKAGTRKFILDLCLPRKYVAFTDILCLLSVALGRLLEHMEGLKLSTILSQISESFLTKKQVF